MSEDHTTIDIPPSKDERTWAMLCHFSAFAGCVFPFGNILAPLIIWLSKREDYPLVADQGKEILNFQISMTLYFIVSAVLAIVLIGIPILIGLAIFEFIIIIVAAIKANDGTKYRYPITIHFLD